jgi:hypothetical protein
MPWLRRIRTNAANIDCISHKITINSKNKQFSIIFLLKNNGFVNKLEGDIEGVSIRKEESRILILMLTADMVG